MKPIQRLKQLYRRFKYSIADKEEKRNQSREYHMCRAFCLDCDLLTFQEVEQMEYEVDKNLVE